MDPKDREEFATLKLFCDQLKKSLTLGQKVKARHLLEVRDYIRVCDHIVEENKDKILLFTAFRYWLECRKRWSNSHPHADVDRIIPKLELKTESFYRQQTPGSSSMALATIPKSDKPEKSWEESLNKEDEKFLEQLYSGKEA